MKVHTALLCACAYAFTSLVSSAAVLTTTVSWESVIGVLKGSNNSTALTAGTGADGDGAVLELGYYSTATTTNNFSGTWIPLTGPNSANTAFSNTSIGDQGGGPDGQFSISTTFTAGSPTTGNNLPGSTSIPLVIRFYNATTIGASTAYGAVSNDSWLWVLPSVTPGSTLTLSLNPSNGGNEWLGGGAGFYTNIPVPEPTSFVFVGLATLGMTVIRRRR